MSLSASAVSKSASTLYHLSISEKINFKFESPLYNAKTIYYRQKPLFAYLIQGNNLTIYPLIKAADVNKETYWPIKVALEKLGIENPHSVGTYMVRLIFENNQGRFIADEEHHYRYFEQTMREFVFQFHRYGESVNGGTSSPIPTDPYEEGYSHIQLFSAIYYAEVDVMRRVVKKNGSIMDIGCGHGEAPLLFAQSFPLSTVIGTDLMGQRFQCAGGSFQHLNSSLNKVRFAEHDFLEGRLDDAQTSAAKDQIYGETRVNTEPLCRLIQTQTGEPMVDAITINHVLEHIDLPTASLILELLKHTRSLLCISLPREKRLNTTSGHKRLYNEYYFEKELWPDIERVGTNFEPVYDYTGLGVFALKSR
ncbi:hypothetical protein A2310_04650 [candidate division WOR-1 bacterium RIFOXYB2_FULL_37_13]|uniref:Methyltransferase domain-containing protein n=1 Tax=candidate division WOR-1 bacterium RIFOXYB2_FULL_37_13 TaxID=1802579 RepID=A0A1F4SWC5_UNCSA|nr:MAG: hypothetical protein A2310_04650 [candidate division WOR-1 bacterium RIFOXYB2_FULL_37_13]